MAEEKKELLGIGNFKFFLTECYLNGEKYGCGNGGMLTKKEETRVLLEVANRLNSPGYKLLDHENEYIVGEDFERWILRTCRAGIVECRCTIAEVVESLLTVAISNLSVFIAKEAEQKEIEDSKKLHEKVPA